MGTTQVPIWKRNLEHGRFSVKWVANSVQHAV